MPCVVEECRESSGNFTLSGEWSLWVQFGLFTINYLPLTKKELHVFARVCLSVCLLARLLKNACMDLDEMLRVDGCLDMDELIDF